MIDSEWLEFYNGTSTSQELSTTLNKQIITYFPSAFIKCFILRRSGVPILVDDQVYFAQNYSTIEIFNHKVLISYTLIITVMTSGENLNSGVSAVFRLNLLSN
jgi:hypothetical protein